MHIAVVDPGVGSDRKLLAAGIGGQYFLAPDNGLLTFVAASGPLEDLVAVRNLQFLPPPGAPMTFHGRNILAPAAARILEGMDIGQLGPQPDRYKLLSIVQPHQTADAVVGQVVYIDHFGNLVTNIPSAMLLEKWRNSEDLQATCASRPAGNLVASYAFADPGEPLAVINSMGLLEIAVNAGRACDHFHAAIGAEVRVLRAGRTGL